MNKKSQPAAGDPPQAAMSTVSVDVLAKRPRILVIEDTDDIRYFLTALLKDRYETMEAASGEEGLKMALSDQRPDIILLDVVMPDMDGYEVLDRLGQDPRTADIPVIFLTALSSVEEEQKGLDLGATDYVAKPISPPILLARVRLHLERSANARRLKELSEQLSRYLAPQVYQSLFDGSRLAEIQTERKKLTVFFSDIKNFTTLTAQWQPEEVTFLLNSYFAEMSQIAAEYGATLDKFIGDAIVIFFGDPHTFGVRKDAMQCVRMALAMQARMGELRTRWRELGINKTFEIRIGINSGFCDVGNFGSDLRMEYTIIGREVNLAARLEQAANPGEILISSETYGLVQGEIQADARDPVVAKGFSEPISAYAVRPDSASVPVVSTVVQCNLPGLRVEMDVDRLSPAERADAAAELRKILERLEAAGAPVESATGDDPASVTVAAAVTVKPGSRTMNSEDASFPESIAGLDIALGLSRAMGIRTLYVSMLDRFREGRKDAPDLIRQALDSNDLKTAELLTHSLRGVAGQIGATQVPQDALALEQAIHEARARAQIDVLLQELEASLGELVFALESGLPATAAGP